MNTDLPAFLVALAIVCSLSAWAWFECRAIKRKYRGRS